MVVQMAYSAKNNGDNNNINNNNALLHNCNFQLNQMVHLLADSLK